LKDPRKHIELHPLSPWAKAGIAIKNLEIETDVAEHDNSAPHRDDHYLIILVKHGQLSINLDFQETIVSSPALFMVFPGQVHHVLDIKEPKGWAISFDATLINDELQLILEKEFKVPNTLAFDPRLYDQASALMGLLSQLQTQGLNGHRVKAAHSLLDALLNLVADNLSTTASSGNSSKASRGMIIEQSFHLLLKQHYKEWKQPSQYAEALHISVAHLYDTIKGITGNSVSELIQLRSVLEAKRLLYFTNLSVREIAYQTGYQEPVYFGKLFKKITRFTPLQFRQQYHD
jgi:AraC family transcriptional activator of pobA